jgi:hypothetical protein
MLRGRLRMREGTQMLACKNAFVRPRLRVRACAREALACDTFCNPLTFACKPRSIENSEHSAVGWIGWPVPAAQMRGMGVELAVAASGSVSFQSAAQAGVS